MIEITYRERHLFLTEPVMVEPAPETEPVPEDDPYPVEVAP